MQVQRGAGTSTNGAGAFGASINMQTGDFSMKPICRNSWFLRLLPYAQETVKKWERTHQQSLVVRRAALNVVQTGYIDRASQPGLNSYYLQGYYNDNTSIKLITFAGKERTYHAWNYASGRDGTLRTAL